MLKLLTPKVFTEPEKVCDLPFTYLGNTYQDCTSTPQRGSENKAWCLTDASDTNSFQYCAGMETSEMSVLVFSKVLLDCVCYADILHDSSDFKND